MCVYLRLCVYVLYLFVHIFQLVHYQKWATVLIEGFNMI